MRAAAGPSATSLELDKYTFTGLSCVLIFITCLFQVGVRNKPVPLLDEEIAATGLREDFVVLVEAALRMRSDLQG